MFIAEKFCPILLFLGKKRVMKEKQSDSEQEFIVEIVKKRKR